MNKKEFDELKKKYKEIREQAFQEVLNKRNKKLPIKVTLECSECCSGRFITPKKLCKECINKIKDTIKNFKKNNA